MAHHLTHRRGRVEMAYVGEKPWHGLGQLLTADATIETWIKEAGMDWTIRRVKPMYYADRAQKDLRVDNDFVYLIRSDTGERLGYVSADYNVVQPYEILEFFRDLVDESGLRIETAGTLFGGKRFWALAKVSEAKLAGWDQIGGYVLLSTSADGSRATEGQETTTRVVCNNTIRMAWEEDVKRRVRISHRERFDHAKVKKQLELVGTHFAEFVEAASALTKAKVSEAAAEDFVLKLLRPTQEAIDLIAAEAPQDTLASLLAKPTKLSEEVEQDPTEVLRRPRGADKIISLFLGEGKGSTEKGSKGTAWGLLNAVTEYVDHHATAKTPDHHLDRALWGSGAELKQDAMALALATLA